MKTADRENQNRYTSVVATRDHGTQDQNHPAQRGRLDGKKNSGRRRSVFSLTPFMELIRQLPLNPNRISLNIEVLHEQPSIHCDVR
jgi:hypothetical protein